MKYIKNKENLLTILTVFCLYILIPATTYAGGAGLLVEDTLEKIIETLQGPVAYFIGVGSIVLAAAGWAASESGSSARQGFKIATALAIMFNATTLITKLWSKSGGLGF